MAKIVSNINPNSDEFKKRYQFNKSKVEEINAIRQQLAQGGPPKAHETNKKRGKMFCRERIDKVIDKNTPFLEIGPFAAYGMYNDEAPCAGIVTGIGRISGKEVMIIANDQTVKGGTYYPMTIKKHIRAQQIAKENGLHCLYLVDSGGVFLPMQDEVYPDKEHFGNFFYNQAKMSSMGLLQVAVVTGLGTAGGAYVPAMCDQVIMVKNQSAIFIGGPPLVKAATGEEIDAENLGGADVHTRISGVADYLANNEEEALKKAREIFAYLPNQNKFKLDRVTPRDPLYDPEEIYGILTEDLSIPFDIKEIIARIVDESEFEEFKPLYGQTVVTGFGRIGGYLVGIVGNNGIIFPESSQKAAHFIELCSLRKVPLIFLQNITGFIIGKKYEHQGMAKDGAKWITAVSTTNVPKITIIVGNSYGAGNYAMAGRGYNPRFLWMYPTAKIAVMGPNQAAEVLSTVKVQQLKREGREVSQEELEAIKQPILEEYAEKSKALYSSARLWDDGIIDPKKTREYLMLAIEISLNVPIEDVKFGILRM
jgi:acetyl-CoA carboxylase carboxyltransferase component